MIWLPPHCRCVMVMFLPALIVGFLWSDFAQRLQMVSFAPSSIPKVELLRFDSTGSVGRSLAENCWAQTAALVVSGRPWYETILRLPNRPGPEVPQHPTSAGFAVSILADGT